MNASSRKRVALEFGNLLNSSEENEVQDLDYIFQMLVELRQIAKKMPHDSLVYFLEMAALEAGEIGDSLKSTDR